MRPGTVGSLTGLAEAYALVGRLDRDQALAAVAAVLARDTRPGVDRQAALDRAASHYVERVENQTWQAAALELLVASGADETNARAIRAAQPQVRGLGGLGEQGG